MMTNHGHVDGKDVTFFPSLATALTACAAFAACAFSSLNGWGGFKGNFEGAVSAQAAQTC